MEIMVGLLDIITTYQELLKGLVVELGKAPQLVNLKKHLVIFMLVVEQEDFMLIVPQFLPHKHLVEQEEEEMEQMHMDMEVLLVRLILEEAEEEHGGRYL